MKVDGNLITDLAAVPARVADGILQIAFYLSALRASDAAVAPAGAAVAAAAAAGPP
jgi:hypothetical protein